MHSTQDTLLEYIRWSGCCCGTGSTILTQETTSKHGMPGWTKALPGRQHDESSYNMAAVALPDCQHTKYHILGWAKPLVLPRVLPGRQRKRTLLQHSSWLIQGATTNPSDILVRSTNAFGGYGTRCDRIACKQCTRVSESCWEGRISIYCRNSGTAPRVLTMSCTTYPAQLPLLIVNASPLLHLRRTSINHRHQ
jgi:hypothetical protein